MSGQFQYGSGDSPTSIQTRAAASERIHFTGPVRFGRRRTDQVGHLAMTSEALAFRGSVDMRIAWTTVAVVEQDGIHIVVTLHGSARSLRFSCHSADEARRGAVVASHLIALVQADSCNAT